MDLLKAGAATGRYIDLTADDGLDARSLAGPIEVNDTVHDAVVGDGYRLLAKVFDPLHQLLDAAGPVQQGKFRMKMQVDKGHRILSFSIARAFLPMGMDHLAGADKEIAQHAANKPNAGTFHQEHCADVV